ncbi:MAG: amidase [Gemmatimonadota bacterium]
MRESEYLQYDGLGLAELVRRAEVTAAEIADVAIRRIERLNPQLNAVVHSMFNDARQRARGRQVDGVFMGTPFLVKDLGTTIAGEPITSGSRLFRDYVPARDSETAKRFRAAGVIILGKTNTPEFGLTPFCESEFLGTARNPWDLSRTTGGSSGGSGAAVAAGLVPVASGGDGGGSLRIPGSCNGVFGFKPTRGRVPTGPVNGEHWRGATVEHVITRSVRDSAAMLDAIAGPDAGAPYQSPPPTRPFLEDARRPPAPLVVGVLTDPILGTTVHPDCVTAVREARALLESMGHTTRDVVLPVDRDTFNRAFVTMVCAEVDAELRDARRLLGRTPRRTEVEFATWALAVLGRTLRAGPASYASRELQRTARRVGQFFESIDVLLTPTVATPPFLHGELQPTTGERLLLTLLGVLRAGPVMKGIGLLERLADKIFEWIPYTPLFNVTGQPAMSVPLFWNGDGLPVGVQIVGRFGCEGTLFSLAAQLESARPWAGRWPALAAPTD